MKKQTISILVCSVILAAMGAIGDAEAKKPKPDKKNTTVPVTIINTSSTPVFTSYQRTQVIEIIRGTGSKRTVISDGLRREILLQNNSLPPGIRKNLAKGKKLPPGIAKKVKLPVVVLNNLNISNNYNLIVVGSDLLLVDPVRDLVLDIIQNII